MKSEKKVPSENIIQSDDGYIRLSSSEIELIPFYHLASEVMLSSKKRGRLNDTEEEISGISEWVSKTFPMVSISWDWRLDYSKRPIGYNMIGLPYSNVMLCDKSRKDIGVDITRNWLSEFVKTLNWREELRAYIAINY